MENINSLMGHICQKNIDTLQKYTKLNAEKGGEIKVADIGTCAGKSAIAMALSSDGVSVLTVDPTPHESLFSQIEKTKTQDKIKLYQMTSKEFYDVCPTIQGCFIDGIHNAMWVEKDIEGIVKKVEPGYYVMFHDVNLYRGVLQAVKEFEGVYYDFVEICDGEIQKSGTAASIYVGIRI